MNVEFKSDAEIMRILNIKHATFYRYQKKIFDEDKDILKKTREESLEHDQMQVRRTLEYIAEKCISIIESKESDNTERLEALELLGKSVYAKVDSLYGPTKIRKNVMLMDKNVKELSQ